MLLSTKKLILESVVTKHKVDFLATHFVAGVGCEKVKFDPIVRIEGTGSFLSALLFEIVTVILDEDDVQQQHLVVMHTFTYVHVNT